MTDIKINREEVTFRPITPEDESFLLELYATTREHEMSMVDWSDKQKADFISMQFNAQHNHYQKAFSKASYNLILLKDTAIGRLYLDKGEHDFLIIDIALFPAYCNRGLGSTLLQEILAEAKTLNMPVKIHVEKYNPALTLYRRLGFTELENKDPYYLMEWRPDTE